MLSSPGRNLLQHGAAVKAFVLFSLVFCIYIGNGRVIGSSDTLPARYLPLSILREFDFDLDEFPFLYQGGWVNHFLQYRNGRYIFLSLGPILGILVYSK